MGVVLPGAIGAATGLYGIIAGGIKSAKANRMAKSLKRPTYNIPQEDIDNLMLAQSMGNRGLSDTSEQVLLNNADRGLSSSINAILQGGGDVNSIGNVYDKYLGNINQMTLADDAAKIRNINAMMNARYRMSDQKDKQWQLNEYAPWADKKQEIGQMKAQGQQMLNAGIGQFASGLMGMFGGGGGGAQKMSGGGGGNSGGGGEMMGMDAGTGGGGEMGGAQRMATSDNIPSDIGTNNFTNNFGIDISKMNSNDASMVNNILYNNNNNPYEVGQKAIYGPWQ